MNLLNQIWGWLKDSNRLIRILFLLYVIMAVLDCGTTIYAFEIMNIQNCSLSTNDELLCETNIHIYNSEGALFHLIAMLGIAYMLRYFGLNYSIPLIKGSVIAVLESLAGATLYAVVNNLSNIIFLCI